MVQKIKANYHWVIAAVVFLEMTIYGGILNNTSIFLVPVTETLQISRGRFAVSTSIYSIVGVFSVLLSARYFRRFGYRKSLIFALLAAVTSMFLYSASQTLVVLCTAASLLGLSRGICFSNGCTHVIGNWFHKHYGLIMGIITSATGLGGGLFGLIYTGLIDSYGWRSAYAVSGIILLVMAVIAILLVRSRPQDVGLLPYGEGTEMAHKKKSPADHWEGFGMNELKKMPSFYLMVFTTFFACLCCYMASPVLTPYLQDCGMEFTKAASVHSIYLLLLAGTKFLFGWLSDVVGAKKIAIFCAVATVITLLLLINVNSYSDALVVVVSLSMAMPTTGLVAPLLGPALFGYRVTTSGMGIILATVPIANMVANQLSNSLHDIFGSYRPIFGAAAVAAVVVILLYLFLFALTKKDRENSKNNNRKGFVKMDKKKLQFGWAEIDITPDKKASLAGQFAERISEYVEKPITATALAVRTENDQMVMVSVDLVGIGFRLVEAVRDKLADNTAGLDPQKVIISAIHTHTAPHYANQGNRGTTGGSSSFRALLESNLPPNKKYIESANITANPEIISNDEMFDLLVERLSKVILQAWTQCAPGAFTNAFGRAVVGMCRRAAYSDGSAQMWGDTNTAVFEALEGGNDSGIELLYVFDDSNKLTGIVANLACPAQCVQHRLFISPDFWGEVKMLLRKHFGEELFLLALCSAAGDQCPVDLIRWVEPESDLNDPNCKRSNPPKRKADPSMFDLAGMRKTGKRIATEIIDVYEDGLDEATGTAEFVHDVHWMQLPLRRVTLSDVAVARKAIKEYFRDKEGDVDYNDAAKLQVHLGILRRFELQEKMEVLDTEVHIARLGPVAFASNPFELFLDYGNQIKARSLAEQTFLIQLACGTEGYLPTKKAEDGGHYSAFVSSGLVGHVGGEQLVRQTLKEINQYYR